MRKKIPIKWGVGLLFFLSIFIISFLINSGNRTPGLIDFVIATFHLPGLFITYYWTYWTLNKSKTIHWIQIVSILGFTPGLALNYVLLDVLDLSDFIGLYFVSPFTFFGQFVLLIPFVLLGFVHFGMDKYQQTKQLEVDLKQSKQKEQEFKESLLKSQIQPHFLFNALNTLYALARKKDAQTEVAVLELSDLLRYTVESNTKDWVSLKEEVAFLKAYCGFQEKRLSSNVQVKIEIQIENGELKVPPLLFQPLIENAYNYVDGEKGKEIKIKLHQNEKEIFLDVENTCIPKEEIILGQGLNLVENRLKNTYGNQSKFSYGYNNELFKAQSKIEL